MSGIGGWARQNPDATALITPPGEILRFGDLEARQQKISGLLREGVAPGDRIAILARNRVEVIEIAAAALRCGVIPVPINPLLTEPEVAYILEDSGAPWLFTDRPVEHPQLDRVITLGDAFERCITEAVAGSMDDHISTRPMHYTSGTTGAPKGVYAPPLPAAAAAAASDLFKNTWAMEPSDLHLVCSPLAHSAPLRFALRTLEAGGAVAVQERFDAEQSLAAIHMYGVTSSFVVPTHLERILALGRRVLSRYDLSAVRLLAHAGAPIGEAVKRKVLDLFPPGSVWEFYGSTEGQATRISSEEWLAHPGSVGQAYPGGSVQVSSEDGRELAAPEIGRIWIRDPHGDRWRYWGDDAKTGAAWRGDFFTVGDLGWMDGDGYLYLVGRADDTIITGGVNVYPAEVEAALGAHEGVAAVLVYGAPSEAWGTEVRARVVPVPGASLSAEALTDWARERLAAFKIPKHIELVEELARTPTGKIKRPGLDG